MSSGWVSIAALAPLVGLFVLPTLRGSRVRRLLLAGVLTGLLVAPSVAMTLNKWRPFHAGHRCWVHLGAEPNQIDVRAVPCEGKHPSEGKVGGAPPKFSGGLFITAGGTSLRAHGPLRAAFGASLAASAGRRHRHARGWPVEVLLVAGSLVGLALLVGGVVLVVRRRRPVAVGELPTEALAAAEEDALAEAEEETLAVAAAQWMDDLRAKGDVRRAIIACYGQMERALAGVGTARQPAETPFEYLARVLEAVAAGPARVLTELYERAMFSLEPMGEREKEQAMEALESLRRAAALA